MLRRPRTSPPQLSAYDKALSLLARREHSRLELQRKLAQAGYPSAAIGEALARLDDSPYQDDGRFGEALLRSRVQQGYGPLRIRVELRSHGLEDQQIAALLAEAAVDWEALARRQLQRHYGTVAAEPAERQRQAQYLQRRGFDGACLRAATRIEDTLDSGREDFDL